MIVFKSWKSDLRLVIPALVFSVVYGMPYYNSYSAWSMVNGTFYRPALYRQLMPLLAQLIMTLTNLSAKDVVILLFGITGVAFALSLRYFMETFWKTERADLIVLALLGIFMIFFGLPARYLYDFATAFFFTLALAFLARGKLIEYLITFALSCINRETTIFLLPVFVIYSWGKLDGRKILLFSVAQLFIFGVIQAVIRFALRNSPGLPFWFMLIHNIRVYAQHPDRLLLDGSVLVLLLWLIYSEWKSKPLFLRQAFILFPIFFCLFILFGAEFEYRAMIEPYSVVMLLALPTKLLSTP